jgi:hypothetical protein
MRYEDVVHSRVFIVKLLACCHNGKACLSYFKLIFHILDQGQHIVTPELREIFIRACTADLLYTAGTDDAVPHRPRRR